MINSIVPKWLQQWVCILTIIWLAGTNDFERHASEAILGTLPQGQNSPRCVRYGLYAEQMTASAFVAPRHLNKRSWLYRARPAVAHQGFVRPTLFASYIEGRRLRLAPNYRRISRIIQTRNQISYPWIHVSICQLNNLPGDLSIFPLPLKRSISSPASKPSPDQVTQLSEKESQPTCISQTPACPARHSQTQMETTLYVLNKDLLTSKPSLDPYSSNQVKSSWSNVVNDLKSTYLMDHQEAISLRSGDRISSYRSWGPWVRMGWRMQGISYFRRPVLRLRRGWSGSVFISWAGRCLLVSRIIVRLMSLHGMEITWVIPVKIKKIE